MDLQTSNTILFFVVAFFTAVIIVLLAKRGKAMDKELDLTLKVSTEKLKARLANEKRETFENLLNDERDKLNKIHLRDYSAWLFKDKEFVEAIADKVDELRPAALERYNAKQKEELRLRAEEDAASMKRLAESGRNRIVSSPGINGKDAIVAGSGISADVAIVSMNTVSSDTGSSFSGSDSCSVDSSCM